jgi:hypothetical protein
MSSLHARFHGRSYQPGPLFLRGICNSALAWNHRIRSTCCDSERSAQPTNCSVVFTDGLSPRRHFSKTFGDFDRNDGEFKSFRQ